MPDDEELTQNFNGAAPSPADLDKTQVVPRTTPPPPAPSPAPVDPAAEERTTLLNSQRPPTPRPTTPLPTAHGQLPPRAPAPPPYGPTGAAPTAPPYPGPRGGTPQPPPPGYGPGAAFPPPPHQGYPTGAPVPPQNPYGPSTSQNPVDAANALLAKGNSLIERLMGRGIRGELIRAPWFLNFRHQSPDQFVYLTYGVGLLLAIVFSLLPGVVATIITDLIWAGLIYTYFALGTKLAHQFVAYGVGAVGAVLALLSALYTGATFVDLASMNFAGTAVLMLISLGAEVISAAVLAYIGLQVHHGIQRLCSPR
jgi:hypothetical protein